MRMPLIFAVMMLGAAARAEDVSLTWDFVEDGTVADYRVYWGIAAGTYTNSINSGGTNFVTVEELSTNSVYHFAVTAIGTNGLESVYSTEAIWNPLPPAPAARYETRGGPQIVTMPKLGRLPVIASTRVTKDYTAVAYDHFIEVKAAGLSIWLPALGPAAVEGKAYVIKMMAAGTNTIVAPTLLDGQATYLQTSRNWVTEVRSDGATWSIVGDYRQQ